ncbi:uncharacterized protein LOC144557997 [Carex rostrata]
MGNPWYRSDRYVDFIIISLVILIGVLICLWPVKKDVTLFSHAEHLPLMKKASPRSELEVALYEASMPNRTVILTMLNKAYSEADGLLNLFLQSFREGENTENLMRHILFLTVDQVSFYQCLDLNLHCYKINMESRDLSDEVLYMTNSFIDMMWARTRLLSEVLRLGYSFIFTDMDILWLRNPFKNLKHQGEDMLLGCDGYNGLPYDDRNSINTGFFFVSSNNNTISFLDKWYAARNNSEGKKEQDVLNELKSKGEFHKMGIKVRYLDLEHFSGMCQTKYDAKKVTTVHANCCQTMKAKMMDLTAMLETWRTLNSTSEVIWPRHKACHDSWKVQNIQKRSMFSPFYFFYLQVTSPEDDELETTLKFLSNKYKTVIITIINKSHTKKEGLLDLFLRGLRGGAGTDYLNDRILFVAVDQVALSRCNEIQLNCYKLEMSSPDLLKGVAYKKDVENMWMKTYFLRMVLKRGYSFVFTNVDVLWLRNPLKNFVPEREDMSISCDTYNGKCFDNSNSISTGFFFVASNNKTITFFDKWYGARNNSGLATEQDALNYLKTEGVFDKLNMKVRYLESDNFCGLCQRKCNVKKVMTVNANCCGTEKAKISDLSVVLKAKLRSDGQATVKWPKLKACLDSLKVTMAVATKL